LSLLIDDEVLERLERLEVPFNRYGVDPYGISKAHLARFYSALKLFYRSYFSVSVNGLEHVPPRGRVMLVGNHSGGVALDGAMVVASMFFDLEPPRLAQGMAEKFLNRFPFASLWSNKLGHFTGLPETAIRLLEDDRALLVFPEGARGTAKLYRERHSLVQFGSGFVRLALKAKAPIVPFAFVGGGEAIPTIANSYALGKLLGVPYVPLTPWGAAVPLPVALDIEYGEPLHLEGTGSEDDEVIAQHVDDVKSRIAALIERGRRRRAGEVVVEGGAR
jgi:1-acyl-sn-glycerol-3-phosphate acyltransferase